MGVHSNDSNDFDFIFVDDSSPVFSLLLKRLGVAEQIAVGFNGFNVFVYFPWFFQEGLPFRVALWSKFGPFLVHWLHLGILLSLLGLLLRECLLLDQRVFHLLHQDPGRGSSCHR